MSSCGCVGLVTDVPVVAVLAWVVVEAVVAFGVL